MRRRRDIGFVVGVLVAGIVAVVVLGGGMASGASTANTTVSVTVASATSINAAGCASGTANVTDFGTVLPATSNVTSVDCSVVFGSSNDTSMLRAYQTDQAGSALVGMSNGTLDTSFDGDGKAVTAFSNQYDTANDVAIQSDGKIVVVGQTGPSTYHFSVARYETSGALDTTFDTDGKVTTALGGNNDYAYGVAIQPDGKIVAVGMTDQCCSSYAVAVVRYNANGSLDTSFDGDGIFKTAWGADEDYANAVALQADGRIVVGGSASNGTLYEVLRLNTNGSLDTAFDTDGKVTVQLGLGGDGNDVAIQSDGKILITGSAGNGVNSDFGVARFNTNGALDTSFDGDGKLVTAIAGDEYANSLVLQGDGKIVVAGYMSGASADFVAARYATNGALDATFDGDGKVVTTVGSGADTSMDVAIQPDGRIVETGYATVSGNSEFAAVRYTTSGALDTSFDGDGRNTVNVLAQGDYSMASTVQPDGRILLIGSGYLNGGDSDWVLVRYGGNGSVSDWAGSWGAANLFGACLHTVANASNTWALAGAGNCTTAIDANWNALPTTASKIAFAGSGVTNATANLRYGFKATASQQAGTYVAPLTFEVVAPNA